MPLLPSSISPSLCFSHQEDRVEDQNPLPPRFLCPLCRPSSPPLCARLLCLPPPARHPLPL
uniref:Uncharacterized protein n=1 Tax=Arundo donax TaxID=35708 RepID=A0A0A9HFB9_ARUDO